jgi:ABC-type nickel/cobalt efflux system permease component RcnA
MHVTLLAFVTLPAMVTAHPLGNFSINRYTGLRIAGDVIELRYIVDMAEIPTFQELQDNAMVANGDDPSVAAYARRKAETLKERLVLVVNGRRLDLEALPAAVIFPPGAGGLPTLKLGVRYRARVGPGAGVLDVDYRDGNYAERAGWKEIVAVSEAGMRLTDSSVPERDRSNELGDYPTDLLAAPPQIAEAHVVAERTGGSRVALAVAPGSSGSGGRPHMARTATPTPEEGGPDGDTRDTLNLRANRQATTRSAFTELVATRQLSPGMVAFALAAAVALGALHALEPGHGKTVVAAYLVGSRGTARHALLLGAVVTASHTAGVYLLGGVTLFASRYIVPERLYPWLGTLSGLSIAAVGFAVLLKRYAADGHEGHHVHGHASDAHEHGHDHAHHHGHPHDVPGLLALGITGGIVPCPAALVVLLSAVGLGRVGFGLLLIVAFSVGLATVLMAIGLLTVYAGRVMTRFSGESPWLTRWLPITSSAVITILGLVMAVQALMAAGIVQIRVS